MNLQTIHDAAVAASLEAGAAIAAFYKDSYTVKDKGEDNPLTDADLASDKILEERPVSYTHLTLPTSDLV